MPLAIGPTGWYLIIGLLLLLILGGGVFLAYRSSTRSSDTKGPGGAPRT